MKNFQMVVLEDNKPTLMAYFVFFWPKGFSIPVAKPWIITAEKLEVKIYR